MKIKITYLTWPLFSLALLAWTGVALFAWTIRSDEADHMLRAQTLQEYESKETTAMRLHSIAQDTKEERAKLESIVRMDVVSIVNLIESTGKAAGVNVTVSNVIPEGEAGSGLVATGFVIEARGRFSTLMRVVQLFESIPISSTIGRLDIEYIPNQDVRAWGMSAYIRVLTAEDISS